MWMAQLYVRTARSTSWAGNNFVVVRPQVSTPQNQPWGTLSCFRFFSSILHTAQRTYVREAFIWQFIKNETNISIVCFIGISSNEHVPMQAWPEIAVSISAQLRIL